MQAIVFVVAEFEKKMWGRQEKIRSNAHNPPYIHTHLPAFNFSVKIMF